MGYVYNGKNKKIIAALELAEELFIEESPQWFVDAMVAFGPLTYTGSSPAEVARDVIQTIQATTTTIKLYQAKSSNTLAVFRTSTPGTIFIASNTLGKSSRDVASVFGTIIHETTHRADYLNKKARYGHGSNSSKGKQSSGPYRAGSVSKTKAKEVLRERAA